MTRLGQAWVKACLGQLSRGWVKAGPHLGQRGGCAWVNAWPQLGQGWTWLDLAGLTWLMLTLLLAKAQTIVV